MTSTRIKRYSELIQLPTYDERLHYLMLSGRVGAKSFGFDRIFEEMFYTSGEWREIRPHVIARDFGCDLGIRQREFEIPDGQAIYIHHMNPIDISDIRDATEYLLNPEFLISCTYDTHQAIHYRKPNPNHGKLIERRPNDTCPWRK